MPKPRKLLLCEWKGRFVIPKRDLVNGAGDRIPKGTKVLVEGTSCGRIHLSHKIGGYIISMRMVHRESVDLVP